MASGGRKRKCHIFIGPYSVPKLPKKKLIAYGISETKLIDGYKEGTRDHQMLPPIRKLVFPSCCPVQLSLSIYHCDVLTSVSQHNPSEVIIKHGSAGTAAMAATPAQGGIHYHCQHITNHTQYPQMWQISCCISSSVCWSVSTLHQVTSDV